MNFIAQWKAGGLVYLNEFFPSPTGERWYGTADPVQVTTPGRAQYIALHAMYDQEAAGLQALQNAGVIVIYRPFMESRFHFWWGFGSKSGWTDALWITLWQQHYNYLTQTKKLDNLIWVYSQGFNAGDGNGHNNYPGDAFVDIQGEDVYSDMASADFGDLYANQTTQHPTKPWAMAEWGSGTPFKSTLNFDMNSLITDIQNNMPKTIFFQAWSGMGPPTKRAGWAIAYMQNVKGAIANPYSLVRENLNRPTTGSGIAIPIPASEFASSGP